MWPVRWASLPSWGLLVASLLVLVAIAILLWLDRHDGEGS
jgi:hypothetical protein